MNSAVLTTIAATGFTVAFFHAAIPTHWLPFVLTARVQKWNKSKTLLITTLAGCGHVLFTAALGFLVVAAAASPQVSQLLTFYSPAGPLSGKAIVSTVVYLVAWPNLHYRLRDKQVDLYKAFMVTIVLVALGIVGTFPPVYQLFGRR